MYDTGAFHLHPLNYALGLARAAEDAGATIFETTPRHRQSTAARSCRLETGGGSVELRSSSSYACNGYLGDLMPELEAHILPLSATTSPRPNRSAISARQALIPSRAAVADTKFVLDYYRLSADGPLALRRRRNLRRPRRRQRREIVRPHIERAFPQLKGVAIDYAWGGRLAITLPRLPHVGRLAPNVYFAQGYSGQGVAIATLVGKLIAEAIAGQAARFDVYEGLKIPAMPGGALFRKPLLTLGPALVRAT